MKKLAKRLIIAGALTLPACAVPLPNLEPRRDAITASAIATGDRAELGDRTITPLAIVEDSRCPANVQCIQAGTVRLTIRLEEDSQQGERIIGLEQPIMLKGDWLHLVAVCPARVTTGKLFQAAYRFTFAISKAVDPPATQQPCR